MQANRGFSLVELMIGMAIGLIIFLGLTTVFVYSLKGQKEFTQAAEQVENGRYAINVLSEDIRLAGYYGQWQPTSVATSIADACKVPAAADLPDILDDSSHAVFAYMADPYAAGAFTDTADLSGAANCAALLNAKLAAGSDVLVVRHADGDALAVGATATSNEIYIQANPKSAELQLGDGTVLTAIEKANGAAATIMKKGGAVAAEIRKYRLHVYFVDKTERVPTLKRLELKSVAGVLKMDTVSIAEGIEAFTVEFGLDLTDGDGVVEGANSRGVTAAQFSNVMSARLNVLARNADTSPGFTDNKIYNMGLIGNYGPRNDAYRRHLYSASVRLVNPAGRRDGA